MISLLIGVSIFLSQADNAFPAYVRAAEAIPFDEFNLLTRFAYGTQDDEYQEGKLKKLYAEAKHRSALGNKRAILAMAPNALAEIEKANSLRGCSAVDSGDDARLYSLAQIKQLAKFLPIYVDAALADGRVNDASRAWNAGLAMSLKVGASGENLETLVGIACQAITLASIAKNLDCLTLPESETLEKLANKTLAKGSMVSNLLFDNLPKLRHSIENAFQSRESLVATLMPPDGPVLPGDAGPPIYIDKVKALSPSQLVDMKNGVILTVDTRVREGISLAHKPEADWFEIPERPESESLLNQLSDFFNPLIEQSLQAEAKARTQLRLLRLHCVIQRFRLEHHRLPKNLGELEKPEYTVDPLTRGQFVYQSSKRQYSVFSNGVAGLGKLELRYRRDSITGPETTPP